VAHSLPPSVAFPLRSDFFFLVCLVLGFLLVFAIVRFFAAAAAIELGSRPRFVGPRGAVDCEGVVRALG